MDYKFLGVAQNKIHLEIRKTPKFIDLHFLFEFNSNRKRMSIIIKDGNSYKLYIKGADNVIKSRLNTNIDQPYLQTVEKKIDKFSKLGLRTLLIAFKELTSKEFEEISSKAQALADVQDRDQEMGSLYFFEKNESNLTKLTKLSQIS